jgi:alcohol dehydrogenase
LTARFDIVHGQAVGLMLPHVVRFNAAVAEQAYRELLAAGANLPGLPTADQGAEGLAVFLSDILVRAGLATRLRDCGVPYELLDACAQDAAKQWTGTFNPRPLDIPDFLWLYQQAW